jgi:hypothetical protein
MSMYFISSSKVYHDGKYYDRDESGSGRDSEKSIQ